MTHGRALAAAQTIPVPGDVRANVEDHLRLVDLAAGVHARLLVFPELSLTGYELERADELAFRLDDPRLEPLRRAAKRSAMTLVVGAPVRVAAALHIGAVVLGPSGSVELYTKQQLGAFSPDEATARPIPPPESSIFAPGGLDPLLSVGSRSAAIAVCADIHRPAHARDAARRGAATYLASMFVVPSDLERDRSTLRRCARRHSMVVVFANYGGPSGGLPSAGSSAIWSDVGDELARLGPSGSGVAFAIEQPDRWRAGVVTTAAPPSQDWGSPGDPTVTEPR